ncbi:MULTISPECIES: O-antigen ligase family protein [Paenibacillus]|uniref:Polymerase n=1 Tax=Paenibacillus odorifer TaxID=189426 RepID=A0A1R0Y2D6_9BACL|nr:MULTISPECIES: O-antigen ligase family protein [Paenibacillus]AIQ38149.1 polymerase [Paenibacillus sp. FSL R5-0345]OMD41495.1 polymerase [Paenibacillus odorifer]
MSKPVYGKNAAQSRNVEKTASPIWALVVAFILFLCWAPFQVGLFNGQQLDFEKPIYVSALVSGLLLLVCVGLYFKKFKLDEQRDLLASASILLPLTYALSLFVAVSHYMAMNMLFVQSMYVAVFIIAFYLLKQKQVNVVIQNAILAIAYFIVGFGLLNWLGSNKLAGALVGWFSNTVRNNIYLDAVMTDSNGLRLTSIFQYANTYAAFLMAFLFVAVFALIRSKKWYGTLTHSFMLVPIIVSILLTLSRGGLVLLPVVFILLLLFLKPAQQILWIIHLGVAGIVSLVITTPVTNLGLELNTNFTSAGALKGWGYLLGASIAVAVVSWVIQRFVAPWLEKKLSNWSSRKLTGLWIPLGSVALVGIVAFLLIGTSAKNILPSNMATRLENINFQQHSVLERITFYKDAMKVVKDYPILGAGGGGWSSLYEHYQNNPYTSRQVHNFFLQYLIEVGILGFIVFMGFILYIFYKYIRGYVKRDKNDFENGFFYLIIALSILVHSLLDFNMSYAFMGILVFLGLAGMAVVMDSKQLRKSWNKTGFRLGYSAVLTVGTVFLIFLSISYIGSSNAALKGKNLIGVSNSYEEIKKPLTEALKTRPGHPESVLYLSSLDLQVFKQNQDEQFLNEAYSVLTRALEDEPYNKNILTQLVTYYDLKGQNDLAYGVYRDNADKFNWDISWYDILISRSFALGQQALNQKDETKKQAYFNEAQEAYDHVLTGIEHLKTLPPEQLQGRPFSVTPAMALNVGKMQLLSGQEDAAKTTLKLSSDANYTDIMNSETPWNIDWYSSLISRSFDLGQAAYAQQDNEDRLENMKAGFAVGLLAYNHVLADNELSKTLTPDVKLKVGKIHYMSGQLQNAVSILKPAISQDFADATNREIARWYLAALTKTGGEDQAIYNSLIAADPAEAAQIEAIANSQF